ncbi:MAG: 3-deoxy-D-manno-octulosonic acid transferase [Sphingobacteriales bacterium]|nr:MAG: 3-deoxy-D-manno-octulosonic acid transferase [Sphingobacteriales bacterium]
MSAIIYWLAIRLYGVAIHIAAFFNPKAKLFVAGRRGLLSQIRDALIDERRPRIWMHCASLGEFEQGRPLLEKLRQKYAHHAFVVTFFSPSGYEVRKDYNGADHVFYLPLDSLHNARQFLSIVKPSLCVFVKYELWYFYLSQIASRDIPAILVSAIFRKEQLFFKWYGSLHRRMLRCFTHIFVQDMKSEQLLHNINIDTASVAGDTRFDRVLAALEEQQPIPKAEAFCGEAKVIVAGSTWAEDEALLHKTITSLPDNWKMILVPHEVHKEHIQSIMNRYSATAIRWSQYDGRLKDARVLVIDTVGMLLQIYCLADVAWIGGGFGKDGVHNVLEAAVYGVPVLHGPIYHQFLEAKELLESGGSVVTNSAEATARQLLLWEKDSLAYQQACTAAKQYVLSKTGATEKILRYLEAKKWLTTP